MEEALEESPEAKSADLPIGQDEFGSPTFSIDLAKGCHLGGELQGPRSEMKWTVGG